MKTRTVARCTAPWTPCDWRAEGPTADRQADKHTRITGHATLTETRSEMTKGSDMEEIRTTDEGKPTSLKDAYEAGYYDGYKAHREQRDFDPTAPAAFPPGITPAMRQAIAKRVRANRTVPTAVAMSGNADEIVQAVADWIENPPEWVTFA